MALIALGYRSLSMSAASIGPVKAMLVDLDVGRLRARLLNRLEPGRTGVDNIRAFLKAYAEEQKVPV
jgi:phosphotransferase system enzyme I (PtsP)